MRLRPSIDWLLALIPVAIALDHAGASAPLIGTLIVVTTSNDGRATWFKGVQLLAVYLIFAASVYWMPTIAP